MNKTLAYMIFFSVEGLFYISLILGSILKDNCLGEIGTIGVFFWLLIGSPLLLQFTRPNNGNGNGNNA